MLFRSMVKWHTWLHSCLCFSPLEKLFLKSWLNTSSIASYLSSFLKLFLIAISTAPRHLVDRSSIILASGVFLPRQLLDTLSVDVAFSQHFLDRWGVQVVSSHLLSRCREKATSTDKVLRSCRGRKTPEARMMLDRSTKCRGAIDRKSVV